VLYLYSIKSPATKEKYLLRLGKFLDYLNFQGALEDKARAFARKGKDDSIWAFKSMKLQLLTNATVVEDAIRFMTEKAVGAVAAKPEPKVDVPIVIQEKTMLTR
jgi:hypothetical protein